MPSEILHKYIIFDVREILQYIRDMGNTYFLKNALLRSQTEIIAELVNHICYPDPSVEDVTCQTLDISKEDFNAILRRIERYLERYFQPPHEFNEIKSELYAKVIHRQRIPHIVLLDLRSQRARMQVDAMV